MASTDPLAYSPDKNSTAPSTPPSRPIHQEPIQTQKDELPSSTPVEMSQLESHPQASSSQHAEGSTSNTHDHSSSTEPTAAGARDPSSASTTIATTPHAPRRETPPPQPLNRTTSSPIGPHSDSLNITPSATPNPPVTTTTTSTDTPTIPITLLLTTGSRHPYTLTPAYLKKRNVPTADPQDISVYTLKELIWRDWREDWENRPSSPSSIRLISFGKLLDDRSLLRECHFTTIGSNVVHMTIRPASTDEADDAHAKSKMGRSGTAEGEDGGGGCCRCCALM